MIMESKQAVHLRIFYYFSFLCSYYVGDLISFKFTVFKFKFWHTQVSVLKIGIPMSKTACINPWFLNFIEEHKVLSQIKNWALPVQNRKFFSPDEASASCST